MSSISPTGFARNQPGFSAAVVGEPAGDFLPLGADARHGGAALEVAFAGDDTDGQQTAASPQSGDGAGVEKQPTGSLQMIGQPPLAGGERGVWETSRVPTASPAARRMTGSASRPLAMAVWAPLRGPFGGDDLGDHAALADASAGAPAMASRRASPAAASSISLALGPCADRRCRDPLLVGEDDEGVGFDEVGDQGAQSVVVAELDFVGDDGVVLVDDRHDASSRRVVRVERAFR